MTAQVNPETAVADLVRAAESGVFRHGLVAGDAASRSGRAMNARTLDGHTVQRGLELTRSLLEDLQTAGPITEAQLETDSMLRHAAERISSQLALRDDNLYVSAIAKYLLSCGPSSR